MKKVLLIAAVALCAMSCCNKNCNKSEEGACCDSAAVCCEAAATDTTAAACCEAAATDTVVVEEVVETVAE